MGGGKTRKSGNDSATGATTVTPVKKRGRPPKAAAGERQGKVAGASAKKGKGRHIRDGSGGHSDSDNDRWGGAGGRGAVSHAASIAQPLSPLVRQKDVESGGFSDGVNEGDDVRDVLEFWSQLCVDPTPVFRGGGADGGGSTEWDAQESIEV